MPRVLPFLLICVAAAWLPSAAAGPPPIIVGLDADMSSGSKESGEAIRRGALLAIDEINKTGAPLGRALRLVVRDHRGNPARGLDNIHDFAAISNVVAVLAGLHTPVALHELPAVHKHGLPFLVPWAAGTPIVDNGYATNFVFRVSVRDQYAGGFLIRKAREMGYRRPALLLERTGWGRSNERAMTDAIAKADLSLAGIQFFNWGALDVGMQLETLISNGSDVIMLVANSPEGAVLVKSMAARPRTARRPIIAHWGITGGRFFVAAKDHLPKVELSFLQTFSFFAPPFAARARRVAEAYAAKYEDAEGVRDIFAPCGTAHAYDLVHLLALAIRQAGSADRARVRDALESLPHHEGLVRNYRPAFSAAKHDALDASDLRLARYDKDGAIVPVAGDE